MKQPSSEAWESQLAQTAAHLDYPQTPDLVAGFRQRQGRRQRTRTVRLAWAVMALVIILGLLTVPPVRAAVLDFLQIGSVRIWRGTSPESTAQPAPTPLTSLLDLAGETTLAAAQMNLPFAIQVPAYPATLGPPDYIYRQALDGEMVVLVWLGEAGQVQLSLSILASQVWAEKQYIRIVQETKVNGQWAIWVTGVHPFVVRNGDLHMKRLVEGNTLIWTTGAGEEMLTYRLETDLPLPEAIRVAESLHPWGKEKKP